MNNIATRRFLHRCRSSAAFFWAVGICVASAFVQPCLAAQNSLAVETPRDVAGFQAMELQIKAVASKVVPAVVGIRVGDAWGSGVIVSEDGIVMTAGHVVGKPGQKVRFFFPDGRMAHGITLGVFAASDAGLMKITDPGKWPHATLGQSEGLKRGTWCVAIGHPLGYKAGRPPVVRIGRILERTEDLIRTDCPLVGGDSGGPLLDLAGNIIGINSRIAIPTDANMHVPVDVFRRNWDRMLSSEILIPVSPSRNGPDVKMPLRAVVAAANPCVVRVKCDHHNVALGTIVGPDGWVLTKASELKGRITCRFRDGRELEARIVGIHAALDLAMLKVEAAGLPPTPWNPLQPSVGQWLATAGMDDEPLALGIVSVPRRAIPPAGGVIGVLLSDNDGEAKVEEIVTPSPAQTAGLRAGDVITHVDGEPVPNTDELRNQLRRHRPGETIKLTVRRGLEALDFAVQVATPFTPAFEHQKQMNSMGVGVSKRSDDFPAVLQHDTVLKPTDCGGPVVDLSGKIIGINIAHAGRTETYCIPTDTLLAAMYDLISGRLSPAALEAARKVVDEKIAAAKAVEGKKVAEERAADEKAAAEQKTAKQKGAGEKAADEKKAAKKKAEEKMAEEKAAGEKKTPEKKK
jgi:serine protease Do